MKNCLNCGNAIFDPGWGEYKCKVKGHRVLNPTAHTCDKYIKGEPQETKEDYPNKYTEDM